MVSEPSVNLSANGRTVNDPELLLIRTWPEVAPEVKSAATEVPVFFQYRTVLLVILVVVTTKVTLESSFILVDDAEIA